MINLGQMLEDDGVSSVREWVAMAAFSPEPVRASLGLWSRRYVYGTATHFSPE